MKCMLFSSDASNMPLDRYIVILRGGLFCVVLEEGGLEAMCQLAYFEHAFLGSSLDSL